MDDQQDPKQMLTSIWSLDAAGELDPDENCSPTKQCRNTKDMTFDGYISIGDILAMLGVFGHNCD